VLDRESQRLRQRREPAPRLASRCWRREEEVGEGLVQRDSAVDLNGEAGTRVGYTALRVMGIDVPTWGEKSNNTSKSVGEILV
jgi:hypothetical protein